MEPKPETQKVENQVNFWAAYDWLLDFDQLARKNGFQTRASAIRFACSEQMKKWRREATNK
jgi:hypothetical protein